MILLLLFFYQKMPGGLRPPGPPKAMLFSQLKCASKPLRPNSIYEKGEDLVPKHSHYAPLASVDGSAVLRRS